MIKITLQELRIKAKQRPEGYLEDVLAHASKITETYLLITPENRNKLIEKYAKADLTAPEPPKFLDLVLNFSKAVTNWAQAGFPITEEDEYKKRIDTCKKCPFWKENILDLDVFGKCSICGCSGFKPWLKTEFCPKDKW